MAIRGCSNHVVNDEFLFSYCSSLNEPIAIKMSDGRKLLSTKIDEIKVWFIVGKQFISVDVQQVLYVKGMNANLLSSGKIAEKNPIVEYGNNQRFLIKRMN